MILEEIVEKTKQRIRHQKDQYPLELIKDKALKMPIDSTFPFEKALSKKEMSFILEVKKASPSKGEIVKDFDYLNIATEYQEIGASAISVLTEPYFFKGDNQYLQEIAKSVTIPVLRKDFVIDEYMIYEAKVLGASCILLICSILDLPTIKKYITIADTLGLSCLVEAHDVKEVEKAIMANARMIGVNNRDLKTFTVDITNSLRLRSIVPKNILFVSESGISSHNDIQELVQHQVNAVLIGETMMRSTNKKQMLDTLRDGYESN